MATNPQNIDDYRALLFFRQSMIGSWLDENNPVFACCRNLQFDKNDIEVNIRGVRARYGHLQHCKRLWLCPVCANQSARKRRKQMQRAIETMQNRGCGLMFNTYTVRHAVDDTFESVRDRVLGAHKALHSGRAWQKIERKFGWKGSIKVVETTLTDAGWHVHLHEIAFTARATSVRTFSDLLDARWSDCVQNLGGYAKRGVGFKAERANSEIRDYVAKWGIVPELTGGADKRARRGGVLPLQLPDYLLTDPTREPWCRRRWREYAGATKGVKQVWASPSVRPLMATPPIVAEADDTLVEESARLSLDQWSNIWKLGLRSECLLQAERGTLDKFLELL